VLRFRLYQTVSVSDFLGAFQVSAFAFPFPASPTLPDPFSVPFPVGIHFQWPLEGPLAYSMPCGSLSAFPTLSEAFDRPYRPLGPD
ncbi:hypothetical protein ACFW9X_43110, partial [Streptomyces sp. NPDC059466]|uniref:hypothetical protein n=1 Tax=Streptomyces sp. NPDC059466 TaxID=3346843 RepID=UPI00368ED023